MKQPSTTPELGSRFKVTELQSTRGFIIDQRHLDCRRLGATGTYHGYVPGHGGDVWWIRHDHSENIGAYCFTELEPLNPEVAWPPKLVYVYEEDAMTPMFCDVKEAKEVYGEDFLDKYGVTVSHEEYLKLLSGREAVKKHRAFLRELLERQQQKR